MGDLEPGASASGESTLGYHPSSTRLLTPRPHRAGGQCQTGSLTGAVASQSVTEAPKGSLRLFGNQPESVKAQGSLTARETSRADTKVGLSDLVVAAWNGHHSTDKSYLGDNRLILPESPHRREGLAPRCRLVLSWSWSRFQGSGCSPVKRARELGSERRKTVRSLSATCVRDLTRFPGSTRGPREVDRWCTSCPARGTELGSYVDMGEVLKAYKREAHSKK